MENEYVANQNSLFIPTKSLKVFPDAQGVDIKPNGKGTSQTIFTLPSHLNFINPETFRLRYNLTFSGRGMPKPSAVAGVSSLWRHMRLQTQNGLHLCEEVEDYSSRVAMEYSYGQDDGKIHDRELNEGLSLTDNSAQQLFWAAQNLPSAAITTPNVAKKVAISQPLWSGLLGESSSVLPVAALGGLKLTMETNNLMKSIKLANDSSVNGVKRGVIDTAGVAAGAWNNASLNHIQDVPLKQLESQDSGFEIGDGLYYQNNVLIGLVVGVKSAGGKMVLEVRGAQNASTNGPALVENNIVFTLPQDRFEGWTPAVNMRGTGTVPAAITLANQEAPKKIDYTITELEAIVEQVQPPESYIQDLVRKINSSEGLVMNYKNVSLFKINQVGSNGLLNSSIPNTAKRVYSINAMPLNATDTYDGNNLTCVGGDGAQSYQFVINDTLTPDQRCSLRRMSLTPPNVEQLHLQELRKSLMNSGVFVRNLQNAEKNFVIGRAVSMYGSVSDITKSDLSLRVEYSGAVRQKTLNVYVCSARTLVVRNNEIQVIN